MSPRLPHVFHVAAWAVFLTSICFDSARCASAQQLSPVSIAGRWRSLETSKGGIGTIIEFHPDGTMDFSLGAVVEVPWRIENTQLILPPATSGGPEQKYALKWLGKDKLKWESEAGATELTRVGNSPDAGGSIVGEWTENREMAGVHVVARYLFYARGELLLLIPFANQHGSYTSSGSSLHVKMANRDTEEKFKLEDNHLTLSDLQSGRESHYARY
jgi:hypothetical protein